MRPDTANGLHPGPLELSLYVRGTLEPGHAATILAHCLICDGCSAVLATMLPMFADDERVVARGVVTPRKVD